MSINEFAQAYASSDITRFHMPGHKGVRLHGLEPLDLTEVCGADFLFEPSGIIAESEQLTTQFFGSALTCYSAEGSSLSIKAALCMVRQLLGRAIAVASPRNCHRAFLSACVLLDIDPIWIYPEANRSSLCKCEITPSDVQHLLDCQKIDVVYITSPDYLGTISDIKQIADICHSHGTLLICDNAHGAYLKLMQPSLHPLDLGADIVCDSAHKTLPAYTGTAYLHISHNAPNELTTLAKPAMSLFGSTSPSYLLMESLDLCAKRLNDDLPTLYTDCAKRVKKIKALISSLRLHDVSDEPLKITLDASACGYDGNQLAELMRKSKIECEYSDPGYVVLMLSPFNSESDFKRLENFLTALPLQSPKQTPNLTELFSFRPERAMSMRAAALKKSERISVDAAQGRICAKGAMSCQPSVAVLAPGEKICSKTIKILKRYSIFQIDVL